MKIYTKRGDQGETDLFGGARVWKSHTQVCAYGAVDSANSAIGFCYSSNLASPIIQERLLCIMRHLFDLGAELSTAPTPSAQNHLKKHLPNPIGQSHIQQLESWIDESEKDLPPLKNFVLPTGTELASRFHLARTAVRTAEREVVLLQNEDHCVRSETIQYLNRLSDLLFVWSRLSNHQAKQNDIVWQNP